MNRVEKPVTARFFVPDPKPDPTRNFIKSILYWLLDAAIINTFCIQYIYMQQQEIKQLPTQLPFRERLYIELFEFAALAASTKLTYLLQDLILS